MKNNKGFTLSELLVSAAIFGIVLAAIFGFMLASAKSFNKVNDRVEIQGASQAALNLLEEYAIDCSGGIAFMDSSSSLYIFGAAETTGEETNCNVDIFRLNEGVLEYGKTEATLTDFDEVTNTATYSFTTPADSAFYKVAAKTVNFAVTLSEKNNAVSSVEIMIGMKNRSADYSGSKNIALRNTPPKVDLSIIGK